MIARTPGDVRTLLQRWRLYRARTIVAVDYSNVRRWQDTLGWEVNLADLGRMASSLSEFTRLRRLYCAADFGPNWRSMHLKAHSQELITQATTSGFEVVAKRVKYIREEGGYVSKCDLDIEIATDLFALKRSYDRIILFSGDGDFVPALAHLNRRAGKTIVIVAAVGSLGREFIDAHAQGVVSAIIYADDLKHHLDGFWP